MHPPSPSPRPRSPRRPLAVGLPGLALAAGVLLAVGCEEERHDTFASRPKSRAADVVGVDTGDQGQAPPRARAEPPARKQPEFIVGKRTQDIKDANAALKSGQARKAETRIVARDPITLQGNAYVVAIGQIAIGQIKQAVDLYQAENGRYPRDLDEFMEEIIKKNNIALPKLPPYQDYAYDANQHNLIVIEYPDRK